MTQQHISPAALSVPLALHSTPFSMLSFTPSLSLILLTAKITSIQ